MNWSTLPAVRSVICAAFCLLMSVSVVAAQQSQRQFVTRHTGIIGGRKISYTATVEQFTESNAAGDPVLSLVATSYLRDGVEDLERRPVLFIFNGGPSGSSFLLHMQLGPEMPRPDREEKRPESPRFIDNPNSPLDVADMVFFDPAETGYSRVLPGGRRSYYYSVSGDTESLAQMIIAWVGRHHRERSPVYLLGESYGSIRAVVTATLLKKRLPVSGLILFGNSLPIGETSEGIVAAAAALPMEAMAAAYQDSARMGGQTPAKYLDEVYRFAIDQYLPALAKGNALPAAQARHIARQLSAFTGIPASYYLDNGLIAPRPLASDTRKLSQEALQPPNLRRLPKPPKPQERPSDGRSVVSNYMRTVLHADFAGMSYREMAPDSFRLWDWGSGCGGWMLADELCYPSQRTVFSSYDWPAMLGDLFKSQPQFRTMIVAGYYDGLSSVGQTRYMIAHHGYPAARLVYREYASGHETAADPAARVAVVKDIRRFLCAATRSGLPGRNNGIG